MARPPMARLNLPKPEVYSLTEEDETVTLSHHLTGDSPSFAFLQAIVKDDTQPIGRRMRAAIASIPYEVPKVAVSSGGTNKDFAERLEGTIRRTNMMRIRHKKTGETMLINKTDQHLYVSPSESDLPDCAADGEGEHVPAQSDSDNEQDDGG